MEYQKIETERLILRNFEKSDLDFVFNHFKDSLEQSDFITTTIGRTRKNWVRPRKTLHKIKNNVKIFKIKNELERNEGNSQIHGAFRK